MDYRLTESQELFINTIFDCVSKNEQLVTFTKTRCSGKTFALKVLDEIFDKNKDSSIITTANPFITDSLKMKLQKPSVIELINSLPLLIDEALTFIEETAVTVDGECGHSRTLEELKEQKAMADIYYTLITLKNNINLKKQ